jgi:hypothetical protein
MPGVMLKSERALKPWLGKALAHGRSLPVNGTKRPG